MITIQFYRFNITTKVVKLAKDHKYYHVATVNLNHSDCLPGDHSSYQKARNAAHYWLTHHYGFCIITDEYDDEDAYFNEKIRIGNKNRFLKEMQHLNLPVIIKEHL